MSTEFVVRCVDQKATLHTTLEDAVKTATHLALTNHCTVEIFEQRLLRTIRVESKIITEDESGTTSEITV